MENAEIARLFRELADFLEIEGANPFRVRAYRTAARTVESHPDDVSAMALREPDRLTELPGVGDDLAGKIVEMVRTGRLHALDEAHKRLPRGLPALMRLPGLGPKRVKALFQELGVGSTAQLSAAIRSGWLTEVPGFGPKTLAQLRRALAEHRGETPRLGRPAAVQYAEALLAWLKPTRGLGQIEVAGSYRRRKDTVGDLDVLATARWPEAVIERFLEHPETDEVLARGTTRATIRLRSGLQVDLRVLQPASFGAGLYYFTGSKAHNIAVRKLAQARGLKVNEYGVWRGKRRVAGRTEAEVARAIGLPLIPPELREDRGEIEAAHHRRLPRLVTLEDIRGDLQTHTTSSDGRDSLEAMAHTAEALGYEYLAITDHTPNVRVAGGLDSAGFRRQRKAVDRLNAGLRKLTVLAGAEVDILPDGRLDLDDATLQALDVVVVSLHSALNLSPRDQTRRICRALRHPAVDILGHPTGRLLPDRTGAAFDLNEVVQVAAGQGVLLEINAQPDRLDLDDVQAQTALRHGAGLVISTDAHSTAELRFMRWGVDQARRGWASAAQVANTRPLGELLKVLHGARRSDGHRVGRADRRTSGRTNRRATLHGATATTA
jgi:DNA polymerase (family 10)